MPFMVWPALIPLLSAVPAAEVAHLRAVPWEIRPRAIGGLDGLEARFFVKVAPETCYRQLADVARLPEFMPGMQRLEVLEREETSLVVRIVGDGGELVQKRTMEPPHRIRWSLVKGTGLKQMHGHWLIEPAEGGAVVTYGLGVRPSVPLPFNVVNWVQEKRLPELVTNVRHRLESGGRWTKPGVRH